MGGCLEDESMYDGTPVRAGHSPLDSSKLTQTWSTWSYAIELHTLGMGLRDRLASAFRQVSGLATVQGLKSGFACC